MVAGPSGAGKSTFLEQLARGQLQQHILDLLPEHAGTWSLVHAIENPQWLPPLLEPRSPLVTGLVLHYDLTRSLLSDIGAFANDPALSIIHRAMSVTVINIRADRDRLLRQWVYGKTRLGDPKHRPFWRVLACISECGQPARPWLRALRGRLHGRPARPLRRVLRAVEWRLAAWQLPKSGVLALYLKDAGRVDALYRSWEAFIEQVRRDGTAVSRTYIRPAPGVAPGSPAEWSVLDS